MPQYLFVCSDCCYEQEVVESMAEHSSERPCPGCGGVAESVIFAPTAFVADDPAPYENHKAFMSRGEHAGRTSREQEKADSRFVERCRQMVKRNRASRGTKGYVGEMPTSLAYQRIHQEGGWGNFMGNIRKNLKRDGCYFGED